MNIKVIDIGDHTPVSVFEQLYQPGTSCLLESVSSHPLTGRYSIIATHPDFIYRGNSIDTLKELLKKHKTQFSSKKFWSGGLPPFTGGVIGYIGYDTVRSWEDIGSHAERDIHIPDIYLLFYSKVVIFDHLLGKIFLINESSLCGQGLGYRSQPPPATARFRPTISKEAFEDMVLKAKEYIAAGDIYQANLSQRLEGETAGSGWGLYKRLRAINPSPFSGYIDFGELELISCSPERLLKLEGNLLQTRPIAGTYPRGKTIPEDRDLAYQLLLHPKERAEHIMLVDLERNDLGRVCDYGSINATELMTIETYSHVHHIVSNISGTVKDGTDQFDIIQALFPGGTITGCPKIRCMQIIDELEPVRRNVYTGSMGYIGYNGNIDLNIIIRTILKIGSKLYLQVGAGIVADSVPDREYYETLHKAGALLEAVTTNDKRQTINGIYGIYGLNRISKR